jgi:hypothetical protein
MYGNSAVQKHFGKREKKFSLAEYLLFAKRFTAENPEYFPQPSHQQCAIEPGKVDTELAAETATAEFTGLTEKFTCLTV